VRAGRQDEAVTEDVVDHRLDKVWTLPDVEKVDG
jgi:hypothetical protein